MLFYANMFGLSGVYIYHGDGAQQDMLQLRLQCYCQTLKLMSQAVAKLSEGSTEVCEELITSTLILAAYRTESMAAFDDTPDNQRPASSALDSYFYHSHQPDDCHSAALKKFVGQKGGIDSIETQGIANLVCLYVSADHLRNTF